MFQIDEAQIESPPSIGMQLNTDFIKGMGKQGGEFIIILDVNRIFSSEELTQYIDQAALPDTVDEIATDESAEQAESPDEATA